MNFEDFMPNLKMIPDNNNEIEEISISNDVEKKQYKSDDIFQEKEESEEEIEESEKEDQDRGIASNLNKNDIVAFDSEIEEEKPILQIKQIKKKRAPMTDSQKEALKRGRERSLANRRKIKDEKLEVKNLQNKKKELTKKKLVNEVDSLNNNISVEDAVLNGIERYDKLRKQRKQEKKKTNENEYIKTTLRNGQIPTQNILGLSKRQQLLNMLN